MKHNNLKMADYKLLSDIELFKLIKMEDGTAYTELYQRYWSSMYFYARKLLEDTTEAEDVVQEVLTYIWLKREEIIIANAMASYLYASVRHKVLNIIQRKKTHDRYLSSFSDFIDKGVYCTDESVREKELIQNINKAISNLPPRMRQIFEMSRVEQLSQKRIAEKLNISDKTVKNQVSHAMKILRLKIHQMVIFSFL